MITLGGVLVLESGGMVHDHYPKADQGNIRVPFGLVTVRGTRFFAGPSNGVFVARGKVMVVGMNTAMMVTSGLGTVIPYAGAEPMAPHEWGAARIASAMASVN
jgi:hypothetical protein